MSTVHHNTSTAEFPTAFAPLFRPSRYKVAHSGRGAAKSWSFARALVLKAVAKKTRILCCREFQLSIAESVHKLLSDQIAALGLSDFFTIQQQSIFARNGSEFVFAGISNNVEKIKSLEAIDVAWCEEAQRLSAKSLQVLIPTIRAAGSELWFSFNPDLDSDPVYRQFVLNRPPDCAVIKTNWSENPWFGEELRREKDYLWRVDVDAFLNIWQGETRRNSASQIFAGKCSIESFEVPTEGEQWDGCYLGVDWGFSQDPTVLVKCWLAEEGRKLYIEDEIYKIGLELDDTGPAFKTIPGVEGRVIRGDSSRPETISFVRHNSGLLITAAEKWKNSVLDGIAWLRSREKIIIHPRCRHTAEEARLYSYRTDRLTGDILPEPVDKHNHCWDAIRYALEPVIQSTNSLEVWKRL
jgi:phage terminase large subunit